MIMILLLALIWSLQEIPTGQLSFSIPDQPCVLVPGCLLSMWSGSVASQPILRITEPEPCVLYQSPVGCIHGAACATLINSVTRCQDLRLKGPQLSQDAIDICQLDMLDMLADPAEQSQLLDGRPITDLI